MQFTTIATYPNSPYKIGDQVQAIHHPDRPSIYLVIDTPQSTYWEHAETLLSMTEVFKQH